MPDSNARIEGQSPLVKKSKLSIQPYFSESVVIKARARSLMESQETAARVLRDAEVQARDIIEKANSEADRIRDGALEAGKNAIKNVKRRETRKVQEKAGVVLQNLDAEIQRLQIEFQKNSMVFAIKVAGRILKDELSARPEKINELIEKCLSRLRDRDRITIHVHPSDAQYVESGLVDLQKGVQTGCRFLVVTDTKLPRSTAMVQAAGYQRASIDEMLKNALESLDR